MTTAYRQTCSKCGLPISGLSVSYAVGMDRYHFECRPLTGVVTTIGSTDPIIAAFDQLSAAAAALVVNAKKAAEYIRTLEEINARQAMTIDRLERGL